VRRILVEAILAQAATRESPLTFQRRSVPVGGAPLRRSKEDGSDHVKGVPSRWGRTACGSTNPLKNTRSLADGFHAASLISPGRSFAFPGTHGSRRMSVCCNCGV
jgi:hypothetical protein